MSDGSVQRSDEGGVATLTLDRPEKLNALTLPMFEELSSHLEALDADESIRCLVLAGAGRSFCAGNDLNSIDEADHRSADRLQAEIIDQLERFRTPTIASVHGYCLTGGLELALGCDLIVASESAQFADTHGQWGLVSAWGMTIRLPERIGLARAKRLMFTAERISASRAAAIGLVDEVAPDDELDGAVRALASAIVANSAGTNAIYKRLLLTNATLSRPEALAFERKLPYGLPDDMDDRLGARVSGSASRGSDG